MTNGDSTSALSRPYILLVDDRSGVGGLLRKMGYDVHLGSFGLPYMVKQEDGRTPVIPNGEMPPDYSDADIVVIDLMPRDILAHPKGEKVVAVGEDDWWAKRSTGIIDPRPRTMTRHRENFDRIFQHGGCFIIFASADIVQDYMLGSWDRSYVRGESIIDASIRSFLTPMQSYVDLISTHGGREINLVRPFPDWLASAKSTLVEGRYDCLLAPSPALGERWLPLATTKYGDIIASVIQPQPDSSESGKEGWAFLFPQLAHKGELIIELVTNVLPGLAPNLYPHNEGAAWVYRAEYELSQVHKLQADIAGVRAESEARIAALERSIENERVANLYLYDLLRATGTALVTAVKRALETLGFADIVEVDVTRAGGTNPSFREDLLVPTGDKLFLVEIKGIINTPTENEALQVGKYLFPRSIEIGHTRLHGLSIINHQRTTPPLSRQNEQPFTRDTVVNAEVQSIGLLTTWDLYRLIRSHLANGWTHEQVRPLFLGSGRIEPVPVHYRYAGRVEHFYSKNSVVTVKIDGETLRCGDRIAYELPNEFVEQIVESMQMDNAAVAIASDGEEAAILTILTKEQVRKGVRVFIADAVKSQD